MWQSVGMPYKKHAVNLKVQWCRHQGGGHFENQVYALEVDDAIRYWHCPNLLTYLGKLIKSTRYTESVKLKARIEALYLVH